jgi:Flp pilus assembly pilin Flp
VGPAAALGGRFREHDVSKEAPMARLHCFCSQRLRRDERGANLVEYVLLLIFIAIVVIAIVVALGGEVSEKYSSASTDILNAGS